MEKREDRVVEKMLDIYRSFRLLCVSKKHGSIYLYHKPNPLSRIPVPQRPLMEKQMLPVYAARPPL